MKRSSSRAVLSNGTSRSDGNALCAVHLGRYEPHVATEHLRCGWSKPGCAVSAKYNPDFKDLVPKKKFFKKSTNKEDTG